VALTHLLCLNSNNNNNNTANVLRQLNMSFQEEPKHVMHLIAFAGMKPATLQTEACLAFSEDVKLGSGKRVDNTRQL